MLPEDRLDALLSSRGVLPQPYAGLGDDDATFAPLLAAAAQLAALADARPSATFVQTLEDRFLSHAATLAATDTATQVGYNTPTHLGAQAFAGVPTHPGSTTPTRQRESRQQRGFALLRSHYPRLLPQAIAASLVLLLAVGALTAAAAAGPGSFLFPLRRFEQSVQLGISGSAADRFKLHLAYASDALTALDGMHGNTNHDKSTYAQALSTLSDEERAAENELANVSDSTQHDDLAAQLQAFKARATHDLYAALSPDSALSWQNRVATTHVLGQLGAQVPHIDAVLISRVDDTTRAGDTGVSGSRSWKITISGTGFTPGAVLTINGHAAGTVTQLSPAQIVALVKTDDSAMPAAAIGIEEPDGTAAQATHSTPANDDHGGPSSATATPASHSGGDDSHSGDSHGGKGSGQGGTPIPTPTSRPGD
ncbi:MAG: hypothetical protein ACXVDA_26730 [Ktedonobacterales bacterium]